MGVGQNGMIGTPQQAEVIFHYDSKGGNCSRIDGHRVAQVKPVHMFTELSQHTQIFTDEDDHFGLLRLSHSEIHLDEPSTYCGAECSYLFIMIVKLFLSTVDTNAKVSQAGAISGSKLSILDI
jgi:hypothetical protein